MPCLYTAVVVGLLLAFFALTFNMRLKPYSDGGLNFVSQVSQLNLLAFLFVALLLKVNLDGEGDNSFFSFIVGIMSIVSNSLPLRLRPALTVAALRRCRSRSRSSSSCGSGSTAAALRPRWCATPLNACAAPLFSRIALTLGPSLQITKDAAWE